MRARKPRNLDKQLEELKEAIVDNPADYQGRWLKQFLPSGTCVHLDLGCGKGAFLIESARKHPDILFVGIDHSDTCIARSAKKALEANLPNIKLVIGDADDIASFFAAGEIERIYLNFNSPFPPKKHAWKRLTYLDRLMTYRDLVGEQGWIDMRTDNQPYWLFSLTQFELAGYSIVRQTEDLHNAPDFDDLIRTEYDEKTVAQGAVVYALHAQPGPKPQHCEQTAELGLASYLPDDLESIERIPYGMEDTVANMRNRRRNAKNRQKWLAHKEG